MILGALIYSLHTFSVPVAFFVVFRLFGAKPAIALAVVVTLIQVIIYRVLKKKLSPFFIVASFFTVSAGMTDLVLASPRVFKFEPFVQNFFMGVVFLFSMVRHKPIAHWFAEGLPERVRPVLGPDEGDYLRRVTWAWTLYFFLKSFAFLFVAMRVDLGTLIILRSLAGGGSIFLMLAGEIFYRKKIRPRRKKRHPS